MYTCTQSFHLKILIYFSQTPTSFILALVFASQYSWRRIWIESDSSSVVQAFKNPAIILFRMWIHWHNCLQLGITSICSHIYRKGNCFANKLATLIVIASLRLFGLIQCLKYCYMIFFGIGTVCLTIVSLRWLYSFGSFLFEGLGLVPTLLCILFSFLNNIY